MHNNNAIVENNSRHQHTPTGGSIAQLITSIAQSFSNSLTLDHRKQITAMKLKFYIILLITLIKHTHTHTIHEFHRISDFFS